MTRKKEDETLEKRSAVLMMEVECFNFGKNVYFITIR